MFAGVASTRLSGLASASQEDASPKADEGSSERATARSEIQEGRGEGAAAGQASADGVAKPPALDPAKLAETEEAGVKSLGQVTWRLSLSPPHR